MLRHLKTNDSTNGSMRSFEKQNYIFNRGRIFPNDWLQTRPYTTTDATDAYYVSLANRVAIAVRASVMKDAFLDDHHILVSAIVLTEWFEDLCSDTRIWQTVNTECKKRYGTLLPFYDMAGYIPGQVNLQDLQLLVWDIVQRGRYPEGRIINPENPGIALLAKTLFEIFDGEYEFAPENERLREYVFNPLVKEDLWAMREWMSWFTYRCYINHDAMNDLMEQMDDDKHYDDAQLYGMFALHSLSSRKNLLSLSSPQWAAKIRGEESLKDINIISARPYLFLKTDSKGLKIKDLVEDKELTIDAYSLNPNDRKVYREGATILVCSLTEWGGNYSLCGAMMVLDRKEKKMDDYINNLREEYRLMSSQGAVYEDFLEANGGDDLLFAKTLDDVLHFYTGQLGYEMGDVPIPDELKGKSDFLLFADPKKGIQIVPYLARCVKHPANPCYDKAYAVKNASNPFFSNSSVTYRLSCRLMDRELLPDATMNSVKGSDYGRAFLHRNGEFFAGYYLGGCREDLEG